MPDEAHDRRLLQQWRSGDVQAGDELLSRHYPSVLRFFANKIDAGVEDLVQAAFTRCLEAAGRLTQDTCFRAYLFGICRHILFDTYRQKRGAPQAIDSEHLSVASLGAGPSTIITNRQQERLLLEALRSLPLDSQILLELYYWENISGRELGEFLDVPENTARSRVRKARERESLRLSNSSRRTVSFAGFRQKYQMTWIAGLCLFARRSTSARLLRQAWR